MTIVYTVEAKRRKRQLAEGIVMEMIKKSVTVEEIIAVIDELHGNR